MKRINKIIFSVCGTLVCWGLLASCQSVTDIPDNLTPSQLIQHGQNYSDLGFYRKAAAYYNSCVERYGTDGKVYVEARYELGHLHVKTKKWQKAYVELREIVQMYEGNIIGQSPVTPTFYKLAKMSLDKIPEKELPKIEASLLKEHNAAEARARAEEAKATKAAAEAEEAEGMDDGEEYGDYGDYREDIEESGEEVSTEETSSEE